MKLGGSINAILFDVGWTLIYPKPDRRQAAEAYLSAQGHSFPQEQLESAHLESVNFYRKRRWQSEAVANIAQFWIEYYAIYLEQLAISDQELPIVISEYVNNVVQFHLYPDTLPVLRELRERGYSIGAVSNWSTELPDILENLGIIDCFDTLVVSDIVGYHKPQPEIFKFALNSLGIHPEVAVHIGDDLEADVEGARLIGIQAILLDRNGKRDSIVTLRINSLEELLPKL